ncbi:MAG: glycosyltransferase family 9 protein [Bacteroidetes bacterium]|nr:glycosyltransferase family 9 protein [Bacteroidota bacterium]MBK9524619.1 glycosyltransferase family 9 protein [Bacteroidota bacterium]MBP6401038.1 glycosyltransferase family 9 protein [Bacteroidia bacterium]
MPKFLIIRFSSIGDIVLTTPVIRCLKQQVPEAEVHFLTKHVFESILKCNPHIDKLHLLADNYPELVSLLKKEKFDYIIDLQHNQRSLRLKSALHVKSFSFHKLNIEKWLMVNFHIDKLPRVHIVDRYLDTLKSFGVTNDGKGLDYFIQPDTENVLERLPSNFQNGYIAFVIGAKHYTKQLPADKIVSICKKINFPVVLLGGKEDSDKGAYIAAQLGDNVYDATGKFSLNESALLVKQALRVITHDTGLMHIAAAFQKEILSVWGNTVPEFGMYPYWGTGDGGRGTEGGVLIEVKGLSCRPCSKIGFTKCPKRHFRCMLDQDEKRIIDWANTGTR